MKSLRSLKRLKKVPKCLKMKLRAWKVMKMTRENYRHSMVFVHRLFLNGIDKKISTGNNMIIFCLVFFKVFVNELKQILIYCGLSSPPTPPSCFWLDSSAISLRLIMKCHSNWWCDTNHIYFSDVKISVETSLLKFQCDIKK